MLWNRLQDVKDVREHLDDILVRDQVTEGAWLAKRPEMFPENHCLHALDDDSPK